MEKWRYAELVTDWAARVYMEDVKEIKRNYRYVFKTGVCQEIDVCVFLKNGNKIAFEVRDRKGKQGSDWIHQVMGKYHNEDFEYIWICTFDECDLSSTAIKVVNYRKIGWLNINVNGNFTESSKPISEVHAIQIVRDRVELYINGDKYSKLIMEGRNQNGEIEQINVTDKVIDNIKEIIKSQFKEYNKFCSIEINFDINLKDMNTNLNKDKNDIKVVVPFEHVEFYDYLSNKFEISGNSENDKGVIISSKEQSIFITDKKLVINLGYISKIKNENMILDDIIKINIKEIPTEYRDTNKIKFINIEGKEEINVYKILGYKTTL